MNNKNSNLKTVHISELAHTELAVYSKKNKTKMNLIGTQAILEFLKKRTKSIPLDK